MWVAFGWKETAHALLIMYTAAKVTSLFRGFLVQDILDCIKRRARAVEVFAKNLQDRLVVKNYLVTNAIHSVAATTQMQVEEIYQGVSAMDQVVRGMDSRCQETNSNIVELKDFISEQIKDALASKNGMFQMLKDVVSGKQGSKLLRNSNAHHAHHGRFSKWQAATGAYDKPH